MFSEFLAQGDLLMWPLLAMVIFVAVFLGVLFQVFIGWRKPGSLSEVTSLPLACDDIAPTHVSEEVSK